MNADVHDLMGAYVAGAVSATEREVFEEHLESCSSCAAEVASLSEVVGHVADAAAVAPPVSLRSAVLGSAAGAAQVASTSPTRPKRKVWPRVVAAAASVLVLAGVGVVGVSAYQAHLDSQALAHDVMMVTTAPDAHSMDLGLGTSHLVMSPSMGAIVAMGEDAPMPSDGMEYQVFLMMADGTAVAGPTFMPASDGSFTAVMSAPMAGVMGVAVTEEPMGGSDEMTGEMVAEVKL